MLIIIVIIVIIVTINIGSNNNVVSSGNMSAYYHDLNNLEDPIESETVYDDTHIDLGQLEKEFEAKQQRAQPLAQQPHRKPLFY